MESLQRFHLMSMGLSPVKGFLDGEKHPLDAFNRKSIRFRHTINRNYIAFVSGDHRILIDSVLCHWLARKNWLFGREPIQPIRRL